MILNPLKIAFLNKRGLNNLNTKILWVANFSSLSLSLSLCLSFSLSVFVCGTRHVKNPG